MKLHKESKGTILVATIAVAVLGFLAVYFLEIWSLIILIPLLIFTLVFGFTLRVIAIYFGLEMPKFIYKEDDAESASSTDEH